MRELYSNFTATTCLDYISSYSREGIKLYQLESADAIGVDWHVSGLTAVSLLSIDFGISDLRDKLIWLKHDVALTPALQSYMRLACSVTLLDKHVACNCIHTKSRRASRGRFHVLHSHQCFSDMLWCKGWGKGCSVGIPLLDVNKYKLDFQVIMSITNTGRGHKGTGSLASLAWRQLKLTIWMCLLNP